MLRFFTILCLLGATLAAKSRVPVVVELFTSEGCSSCPPADSLLADLEAHQPVRNADLIVLSEHVDYWNSLGWKDPFSSALFSERQQSYAQMMNSSDVFTPQAIVDGRFSAVGSNRGNLLKAINSSAESAKTELDISVERQGNKLLVNLPAFAKGDVWLAITEAANSSRVEHGENAGRTLQHVGVVRSLTKVSSQQARLEINPAWHSELRVVVFLQDPRSGRILQAVQKKIGASSSASS